MVPVIFQQARHISQKTAPHPISRTSKLIEYLKTKQKTEHTGLISECSGIVNEAYLSGFPMSGSQNQNHSEILLTISEMAQIKMTIDKNEKNKILIFFPSR